MKKFSIPKHYENRNPKIMEVVEQDMKEENEFHYLFIGSSSVGKKDFAKHISNYLERPIIVNAIKLYDIISKAHGNMWNEKTDNKIELERLMFTNNLVVTDLGKERYIHRDANRMMSAFLLFRSGFVRRDTSIYNGKYYGTPHTIITTDIGFRPQDYLITEDKKHQRKPAFSCLCETYGQDIIESVARCFKVMIFNNIKNAKKENMVIIDDTED